MNIETEKALEAINKEISRLVLSAYEAGQKDTLARIMHAAGIPQANPEQARATTASEALGLRDREPIKRAPRGLLPSTLKLVLSDSPGLSGSEMEDKVTELEPQIARSSVVNELRRQEGKLYRREAGRWYLIEGADDMETE